MASVNYDDIFSSFLGNISDYDFAMLDLQDATDKMVEYLHKAAAEPFVAKLFVSSLLDDSIQVFDYEMNMPTTEDEDREFIIDILSEQMVVAWLKPYVNSKLNIAQFFGGKESHFFSQANHLEQLRGLLKDTKLQVRKLIRDRDYVVSVREE